MSGLAYSSLRAGKKYSLQNFGDRYDFEVIEIVNSSEFKLKDLHTLETYYMSDLTRFGKGKDFSIWDYN
jgi:hypothetical protein